MGRDPSPPAADQGDKAHKCHSDPSAGKEKNLGCYADLCNQAVVYTVEGDTIVIQFVGHRRELYKYR